MICKDVKPKVFELRFTCGEDNTLPGTQTIDTLMGMVIVFVFSLMMFQQLGISTCNGQPKFECQSSSYKRDTVYTILCHVNKEIRTERI